MEPKHRGAHPVSMQYLRIQMQKRLHHKEAENLVFELYEAAHAPAVGGPSNVRANMLRLLQKRLPDIFAPRQGGTPKGKSMGPYHWRRTLKSVN